MVNITQLFTSAVALSAADPENLAGQDIRCKLDESQCLKSKLCSWNHSLNRCVRDEMKEKGHACIDEFLNEKHLTKGEVLQEIRKYYKVTNRKFYITYGPPASGKGSVMKKNILQRGEFIVEADVDHLISLVDGLKEKQEKCMNDTCVIGDDGKTNCTVETKKKLTQAMYWYARGDGLGLDDFSDTLTTEALLKGQKIAWETTGLKIGWTQWLTKLVLSIGAEGSKDTKYEDLFPKIILSNYGRALTGQAKYGHVCVVYPFVAAEELISRAKKRYKETGQEPADDGRIRTNAKAAAENFRELFPLNTDDSISEKSCREIATEEKCTGECIYEDKKCVKKGMPNCFYIYGNNRSIEEGGFRLLAIGERVKQPDTGILGKLKITMGKHSTEMLKHDAYKTEAGEILKKHLEKLCIEKGSSCYCAYQNGDPSLRRSKMDCKSLSDYCTWTDEFKGGGLCWNISPVISEWGNGTNE